jgi:hypothetical protein
MTRESINLISEHYVRVLVQHPWSSVVLKTRIIHVLEAQLDFRVAWPSTHRAYVRTEARHSSLAKRDKQGLVLVEVYEGQAVDKGSDLASELEVVAEGPGTT